MAGETTTTLLTETQMSERITAYLAAFNREIRIGEAIAWRVPGVLGVVQNFARMLGTANTAVAALTAQTEASVSPAAVTHETTEAQATPQIRLFETKPTDHMMAGLHPELGVPAALAEDASESFLELRETDLLALTASATQTTGNVANAMTSEILIDAGTTFRALKPRRGPAGVAAVLASGAAGVIRKSALLSTASHQVGSQFGEHEVGDPLLGKFAGMWVYESTLVADQGAGKSNFITPIGERVCGLALVSAIPQGSGGAEMKVAVNRGRDEEAAALTSIIYRMDYAMVLAHPSQLLELRSSS